MLKTMIDTVLYSNVCLLMLKTMIDTVVYSNKDNLFTYVEDNDRYSVYLC